EDASRLQPALNIDEFPQRDEVLGWEKEMRKISSSIAVSILSANYYLNPAVLQAQATAALGGTIRDSSGAPIPEAKVTALNVRTGLRESRVTGVDGSYS